LAMLGEIRPSGVTPAAAMASCMYEPTMKVRMGELEREKAELEARLSAVAPAPLDINPNIAELYGRQVQRLTDALADRQTYQDVAVALRSLIGDVVLMPGERRGEVEEPLDFLSRSRQRRDM
jgi:site-specific DNA recombinase